MGFRTEHARLRVYEYDALRRRLWILGQRCHHGAAGSVVAVAAFMRLVARDPEPRPLLALTLAGSALMAHDWHDRSIWFVPGHGNQP
jgi:hypothetical protein